MHIYVPKHHEETDIDVLHALIRSHPLGAWVIHSNGEMHAPDDYMERQISAIVGIEIPIDKLVGKWKVSQNRTLPDKLGVIAGLLGRNDARSKEMAALVSKHSDLGNIS